jgi:hypothetical protein
MAVGALGPLLFKRDSAVGHIARGMTSTFANFVFPSFKCPFAVLYFIGVQD